LLVYLSCDNRNNYFVRATVLAIRRFKRRHPESDIDLVFPPRHFGGDTGKVLTNILRISSADVVLFDVTPLRSRGGRLVVYNAGVMIEYGIVIGLDNPTGFGNTRPALPWHGRQPRPVYRVYCHQTFRRSELTPIVNQESVIEYRKSQRGRNELVHELFIFLEGKLSEIRALTSEARPSESPTTITVPSTLEVHPIRPNEPT